MSTTIKLTARDVPKHLRGTYTGRKFRAEVVMEVTIPIDSGLWSGGSRELWELVRLEDGAAVRDPLTNTAPSPMMRADRTVPMRPGFAVRVHTHFMGKDSGLTFYVHSDDVARLLPAPKTDGGAA